MKDLEPGVKNSLEVVGTETERQGEENLLTICQISGNRSRYRVVALLP